MKYINTKTIGVALFLLILNISLIYLFLGIMAKMLESNCAAQIFMGGSLIGLFTTLWLGYRIKKQELSIRRIEGQIIYPLCMVSCLVIAFAAANFFKCCAPESGVLYSLLIFVGFFVCFCIGIKLNDLRFQW